MSKHTQEEIAKQFDLPERQSKIESLLREPEIYCICRSSDSTRFMIACDACEEWYHGDCVNITQSEANNIHHYYCQWCIEKDPSLEIEYKKKSGSSHKKEKSSSSHKQGESGKSGGKAAAAAGIASGSGKNKAEKAHPEEKSKAKGCGGCTGCLNRRDCGKCESCKKNRRKDAASKKKICLKRMCVEQIKIKKEKKDYVQKSAREEPSSVLGNKQLNIAADEDDWRPPPPTGGGGTAASGKKTKSSLKRSKKKVEKLRQQFTPMRESDMSESSESESEGEDPTQCHWYECLNAARAGSKYCSDECGIRLATDRILRLLPSRIQEWNLTPSVAEEKNKKDLEAIRRKQVDCRVAIEELELKRIALDAHIEQSQLIEINPDKADEEVEEEEGSIPCVTCGHEVSVKTCIKHMERCYNKYESQTSFGSAFKTELEGTPIFCDFFHAVNRTYCKRLRVLCPEHSKEPKIRDTAICGYPLIQNVTGPTDKICKIVKKKCNRHHSWEKLRRAEIDLEKVRYWLKLDELLTQERQCKQALTDRAGVLGLLLHSTFDHEIREKLQKQMAEAELKESQNQQKDQEQQQQVSEIPEPSHGEVGVEYDDCEMTVQPSKNREHRKAQHGKPPLGEEEMTASKLFKMNMK